MIWVVEQLCFIVCKTRTFQHLVIYKMLDLATILKLCPVPLQTLQSKAELHNSKRLFSPLPLLGPTVEPSMPWRCTELSKLTSPSLWNLTVDLAARFSQTFFTRASFHRGEEVWLKSFNFQSFFALKIIILYFKTQLSAWNRSIFFLQDLSSRFELAYSALDSVKPAALVGNTVTPLMVSVLACRFLRKSKTNQTVFFNSLKFLICLRIMSVIISYQCCRESLNLPPYRQLSIQVWGTYVLVLQELLRKMSCQLFWFDFYYSLFRGNNLACSWYQKTNSPIHTRI